VTEGTIARHGKMPGRGPVAGLLRIVGIVAAVALVSAGSIAAIAVWDLSRQVETFELPGQADAGPIPQIDAIPGGVNMLLIGSDSRAGSVYSYGEDPESELNDVNILLHISEDHTSAVAVSFPRDMKIPIPECQDGSGETTNATDYASLNTALGRGGGAEKLGVACAVSAVSELTGLTIPFAALISFDGVIEMSNAVGGVPVCVAQEIQDEKTELYLPAGVHELQGVDALKFLRTRYGVGNGSDLSRISSQQVFLSALMRKVKSSETLTSIPTLYGLAGAAVRNIKFSESLNSPDTLVQIARALAPISLDRIAFVQYPTGEDGADIVPNYDSAQVLVDAIANNQAIGIDSSAAGATGGAVVDPNAPAAPAPEVSTGAADAPVGEASAPPASGSPVAVLPPDVSGQTADVSTCTVGRSLDDQ
jgi:LCP family protein required for cell wall assembly